MQHSPVTLPARARMRPKVRWIVENFFGSVYNVAATIVAGAVAYAILGSLVKWAIVDAVFDKGAQACADGAGACWSPIVANFALYMVGPYPFEERWRPTIALLILFALVVGFCFNGLRARLRLHIVGPIVMVGVILLLSGGWLGLRPVATNQWGGLLVTLLLAINGIALAFPLATLLALGRTNKTMPVVRMLCAGFIDTIRGVPLISILFLASFMLPLFLPAGVTVDNLLRALIGIVFYQAAFLAEVIRGGLLAIPAGQTEAGKALGLSNGKIIALVTLPQAYRISIPAIVNEFIATVKETSLVAIIGIFDLLGIGKLVLANPQWAARPFESFAFVALIYWTICFSISRVSRSMENRMSIGR